MAKIDEIKQQAEAVKNATQVGENTAVRVGGALAGLADIAKQQEDNIGKKADKETVDTELGKKADKADMDVELGKKADKEAVNTELGKKANTADVETKFTEEKKRVDAELDKKFDKESIVQESGEAEDKVMSQKVVSDNLSDLSNDEVNNIERFLNKVSTCITSNGNIVTLADFRVEIYKVKTGDIFNLILDKTVGSNNSVMYAMYSDENTFDTTTLVKVGGSTDVAYNVKVTIPEGVKVIAIQKSIGGHLVEIKKLIPIKKKISQNKELILSNRLYLSYNVDDGIKINQKYSKKSDIQHCVKRCGVNNLYQLYSYGFIDNAEMSVSSINPVVYNRYNTDWIGPYVVNSKDGNIYGSGGFTGGFHGSNGNQTGNPTAKHISIQLYADNYLVEEENFSGYFNSIRIVVTNQIMAGNTLDNPTSGTSGYYCIEEEVTYLFKNGRIYVAVKIKALHNLTIKTYYGMQAADFYKDAIFVGDTITSGTKSLSKTYGVFVRCDKGNGLLMRLNPIGLGCLDYADRSRFCFVSGNKSYFSLVGGKLLQMQTGDTVYWSGWYKFCDTLDIEDITTSGSVNIVDDVTTGGKQSALSAEQGKVLSSAVSDIANRLVLIKRNATAPSEYSDWVVGDVYFNRSDKKLYRITSISPSDAKSFNPQTDGYYVYNNEICVWDGEKFVQKTSVLNPNGVFVDSAVSYFLNTQDKIYSFVQNVIKSLKLYGLDPTRKYIVYKISVVNYNGYFIIFKIADITDGGVNDVCTFSKVISSTDTEDIVIKPTSVTAKDLYNSEMLISSQYVRDYFSGFTVESVDSDTYSKYGLSSNCILSSEPIKLPVQGFKRISYEIRKIALYNLDTTRSYKLKAFSFDKTKKEVYFSICTNENYLTVYSGIVHTDKTCGIKRIYIDDRGSYMDLDFDLINSSHYSSFSASTLEDTLDIDIDIADTRMKLIAGDEIELTFDGKPLRLLDCGKNSGCFYMSCGNSIYKTKHILNNSYTASDLGKSIELVYTFSSESVTGTTNFITGINGLRELSTGKLLINVKIDSYPTESSENYKSWSQFYMYDGKTMKLLFDGCWRYHTFSDGTVRNGGAWYSIWDFHEVDNYIFLSERCDQGLGGRAWMSKDYGETWYVIFNAFGDDSRYSPPGLYPVVQPSGFDTEHNDFNRPYLPNHPNGYFHIHGIAYDRWRKQVIIVSGDLTWEQGSYSAVWVLKNPDSCPLYPATDIDNTTFPEGGTWESNKVKMLKCNWTRVGLHKNDTGIKNGNMQFVGCIPYKNVLAFSTDCSGGGLNGVAINDYPSNIVSANFKMSYPLNSDAEETLSHCGGGYLMLPNKPTLWAFYREGSGFNEQSSDQKAAILGSYDGKIWSRLWIDDTLDEKRISKISWGATIIGKNDEIYLRYKGFKMEDNIIRRLLI